MVTLKLIPHLLCWAAIALALLRAFPGQRRLVVAAAGAGFAVAVVGAYLLFPLFKGDLFFVIVRDLLGGSFLLLWAVSVATIYGKEGGPSLGSWTDRVLALPVCAGGGALLAGALAGVISACRLGNAANILDFLLLALAGIILIGLALPLEKRLPGYLTIRSSGLLAFLVALLLLSSSYIIRLDLFSPLTMKVMKFAHDFVHQFFESMLIPDHLFFSPNTWKFVGYLFGKEVGFWGALIIWFTPVLLIALAVRLERLPSVAHIRQGAQRRRLIAAAIRERNCALIVPALALLVLSFAIYRSLFPSVEYWDPKPLAISATPAGEIFIPRKGEIDLEDGKLHKYQFRQGNKEARFFVLMTPEGKLTVDLDACAICKPDGYGQTEGTVICYYCKTLIPLETVGKPGGCNPVPLEFKEKADGVHIDSITLVNAWGSTVQSTARVKGGTP